MESPQVVVARGFKVGAVASVRGLARVLWAMVVRELKVFGRYPGWMVSSLVTSFVWLLPVVFLGVALARTQAGPGVSGLEAFRELTGTQDFVAFIVVGGVLWNYVGAVVWSVGFSLRRELWQGTLESNWLAPVPRWLLVVGRSSFSTAITTVKSLIILAVLGALFDFSLAANLGAAVVVLALTLSALYGIGFCFAAVALLMKEPGGLANVVEFVLSLLAGVAYPIAVLPPALQVAARALPLAYGVDALRGVLLGTPTFLPLGTELAVLAGLAVLYPLAGYAVFLAVERRVRSVGGLAHF